MEITQRITEKEIVQERALKTREKILLAALPQENREKLHSREKLHIMIGLMENYCHTYMEGLLTKKELKYMRGKVIRIIQKELWEEM